VTYEIEGLGASFSAAIDGVSGGRALSRLEPSSQGLAG
jgi:hypothetical protein